MEIVRSEEQRLRALVQLGLLDTPPSESFDRITRMASRMLNLPIAAISLTDKDRQWFKSRVGVDHGEIPREKAPCGEVADKAEALVIPDLLEDMCYRDSLLARSGIRFYAAAPLVTRDGFGLGAMCVLGTEPREITADEQTVLRDLAAMVMAQIELQHAFGRVEPTSGLPNRHQFSEDLQDAARDRPGGFGSVVFMELTDASRLQELNRVLGPGAIDGLVREAAGELASDRPGISKVYQVGQAELCWVQPHEDETARDAFLASAGSRFSAYLGREAFRAPAHPVLGIAPFRLGEIAPDALLRAAHSAALEARASEGVVSVYSQEADDHHRRRYRFVSDMRAALAASDQLSLVFQPRIDLKTGACVGAEALLRWTHPELGGISPGEFIPVVEKTDLARPVTDWVIDAAVKQLVAWRQAGIAIPLSVNVSAENLREKGFAERLIRIVETAGLPSSALEIEVTESAIIRDGTYVGEQLRSLQLAGFKVAIDDFGTGYSSLSYVQALPADTIKIDQSFVRNLRLSERGRILVGALIGMAKGLGFRIVAEGIEDEAAFDFLRDASCDEGQGYWMCRPVTAPAFATWLRENATDRRAAA